MKALQAAVSKRVHFVKKGLIVCNVLVMLAIILFALLYSTDVRVRQEQASVDTFCTMVETLKQTSTRYLETELSYAQDWAAYIEHEDMTMDEALAYIRAANTQTDRSAHIVDMDTFEARTTNNRRDGDSIKNYLEFKEENNSTDRRFVKIMKAMFEGKPGVLGRYRVYESQVRVISVGTPVMLRLEDGRHKSYLLLRVIPVESMKKTWVFPMEYSSAEIGLITPDCAYVIPSNAMKSENFLEFIRGYNYENDYNGADQLLTLLDSTDSGLLEYKNSKREDCYWYYSRVEDFEGLMILGYIPQKALHVQHTNWSVVLVICGGLLLLVLLDGTYVLSINRRLRETAKAAEEASSAKTQFLSSMSHDIRTPLNAVLGMTEIAKKRVGDPAAVMECLNKITVSGGHLLTLINDVLDISKVESGKMTLSPAAFSVAELTAGMESITRSQADSRGLSFEVDVHDVSQDCLVGDKLRLSQIYLNLLVNAVKYTEPGGHIRLEVSENPLPDTTAVELVCIVADDGIGMSEEFQKTMYDSFSRATDNRIDKIQGTGLGLAIAKRMVEMMHGSIDCQSAPGEGTTFTVRITLDAGDVKDLPQHEAVGETAGSNDLTGTRVLIAEDNDLNWEIIQTMLSEYGVQCERAENGQECIQRLNDTAPGTYDLVLMDVQMPVLNGRDAARQLRQSSRADLRSIPIAAMTADAFAEDVQACLEAGMDAHLAKPVDIEKVLSTIRRLKKRPEAQT